MRIPPSLFDIPSRPLADAFNIRYSTKYYDAESDLYYYGYRYYAPSLHRWLTRDPIAEKGGLNLYGFCANCGVLKFDAEGKNIYLYSGNDSDCIVNNLFHQFVAVDVWSCKGKRARKVDVRGFSFAWTKHGKWTTGGRSWLGRPGFVLPGFWMEGVVYEQLSIVGMVESEKKTQAWQDRKWLREMLGKLRRKDVYSVYRHNCRNFSQMEFDNAPGMKIK